MNFYYILNRFGNYELVTRGFFDQYIQNFSSQDVTIFETHYYSFYFYNGSLLCFIFRKRGA